MKNFKSIDEILDFAINAEQGAYDFYTKLANSAKNNVMKKAFEEYAKEELGHKSRLIKIKESKKYDAPIEKVQDLKISDYTTDVEPTDGMLYQDALLLAMKREKNAYKLYANLAEITSIVEMKNLFSSLANEEAKHKLRFEIEYDEVILTDN